MDWGTMGSKVVKNFLDTLPEKLFLCRQLSKVNPSPYDPWVPGEALKNF